MGTHTFWCFLYAGKRLLLSYWLNEGDDKMNDDYEKIGILLSNMTNELVSSRVRVKALVELLTEKGQITYEEYEKRFEKVFERDAKSFRDDLIKDVKSSE